MTTEQHYLKTDEIINKFKNGKELYKNSPLFHTSVQMLLSGASEYEVMEQLIEITENTQKALEILLVRSKQTL